MLLKTYIFARDGLEAFSCTNENVVMEVLKNEKIKFNRTLEKGLREFEKIVKNLNESEINKEWFNDCCEQFMVRQAVMHVIDEYADEPLVVQYVE